ncbi:MAG: TniB family NTP-binding protein [Chloroflexota bacterium]|nr:TniB family NTP-binding protein [Chloroflexota bacterium]
MEAKMSDTDMEMQSAGALSPAPLTGQASAGVGERYEGSEPDQDTLSTAGTESLMDVRLRLQQLQTWLDEYRHEDAMMAQRVAALDMHKHIDTQRGVQIANQRRRLRMKQVKEPIEISPEDIRKLGYDKVRQHFAIQFAGLTKEERLLWLNNFLFIMTPQIRALNDKLAEVRHYNRLGQQRNFLLGGVSGSGKTTYLDWYAYRQGQVVEGERNHVPVVKTDAPKNNKTSKPLFERIIRECGMSYLKSDQDEDLLMKIICYFQVCGVELLILDEIEHITNPDIRRRVLEISNLTTGVPIVCASCYPTKWIEGDTEVAGRWNDYFELTPYRGKSLSSLLAFIELFLPFSTPSYLSRFVIEEVADTAAAPVSNKGGNRARGKGSNGKGVIDGPAKLIEDWTGGVLRDIMALITGACTIAINQDLPCVTPGALQAAMKAIRTSAVPVIHTGLDVKGDK